MPDMSFQSSCRCFNGAGCHYSSATCRAAPAPSNDAFLTELSSNRRQSGAPAERAYGWAHIAQAEVDGFVKAFTAIFGGKSTPQSVATSLPRPARRARS
jgi:hypothetical protein